MTLRKNINVNGLKTATGLSPIRCSPFKKMKRIFIIILVLITFQSFGQKWSLNSIYRSKKYSFEYLFRLDNLDDTSSYQLTKRIGQKKSTIEIFDNQRDTVVLANIKLSNKINDSIIILTSDFNGQSNIKLQGGEYKLEISAQNYDNFDMTFSVTTEEYISLKINLGLA